MGCLRQVRHQIFQTCHIRLVPYEHTVISNGKRPYIRNLQSFEESRLIIGECRQHLVGCRYQNGRTGFIELPPQIILLGIISPLEIVLDIVNQQNSPAGIILQYS